MREEFNQAASTEQGGDGPSEPATRAELDALKSLEDSPEPTLELTPDDPLYYRINAAIEQWRNDRINHLQERLSEASRTIREDWEAANNPGGPPPPPPSPRPEPMPDHGPGHDPDGPKNGGAAMALEPEGEAERE